MIIHLHVLPPALGLPSIDHDCLAAIAYLHHTLPEGKWALVADGTDDGGQFPCLEEGTNKVKGFEAIVSHLSRISDGEWDLNAHLSPQQRADCLAFTAHIHTHLRPLIALSLYATPANYTLKSRPAYASALPFPASWTLPPRAHANALRTATQLGLAPSDLESPSTRNGSSKHGIGRVGGAGVSAGTGNTGIGIGIGDPDDPTAPSAPDAFRGNAFQRPSIARATAARNMLSGLLSTTLEPLAKLLTATAATGHATAASEYEAGYDVRPGEKAARYVLRADRACELDCHLLAALSLALVQELPEPWLERWVRERIPALEVYEGSWRRRIFGDGRVEAGEAGGVGTDRESENENEKRGSPTAARLPWRDVPKHGVKDVFANVMGGMLIAAKETVGLA